MKQTIIILAISILITSCATVLNRSHEKVKVYTTEPSTIIHKYDTIKTVNNKVNLRVERKKELLPIVATTDSITKTIEIKPRNSLAYWLNIYPTPLFWTGFLIDKKNPKRYSYPKRVYINSTDTTSKYYRYSQSDNKGEFHLHFSLPWVNFFSLKPQGEAYKANVGFWGFSIGLDYYHSTNQFINLGATGVMDFFIPFPAAVDFSGEYELMSSWFISVSNNHKLGRFSVGYGLSYGRNTWSLNYSDWGDPLPPTRDPVTKSYYSFGFVFPAYFQLGERFNLGLVYRPTFYRPFLSEKFAFEHLLSIDVAWKIRIKK